MPAQYKALKYSPPSSLGTWAVLDHDGANRPVERYLSSLGAGESGTGVIVSPPFRLATDKITFTLCGHDGPGGGQKKNFIALVDAASGEVLRQTMAPGNDAMQPRSWDVAPLKEREVRIEVHDGDAGNAFAWMGVGQIDAGDALRVNFRNGIPKGWTVRAEATQPAPPRGEVVGDGIPFLRHPAVYTLIPAAGAAEFPCGFAAERVFFLGCTVSGGKPLEVSGQIEIVYRQGPAERFPLMYGYTLDRAGKPLSRSKAVYLHASGDVFQHYLVLAPRAEVIEKIVLRRETDQAFVPRITAITCRTEAQSDSLETLPDYTPTAAEAAWLQGHAISSSSPDMEQITAEIRRAYRLP